MADPSQTLDVTFPTGGLDTSSSYGTQRPNTSADAVNCRAADPLEERLRGGSRHGLEKYPAEQIPEGSELIQHLNQLVVLSEDYLLAAFEDYNPDYIPDPSTNNGSTRNPPGRAIPPNGSGVTPNRNRPLNPRRRVQLVPNVPTQFDGMNVTLTCTLTKQNVDTVVAGATVRLATLPPGKDGHGDTAVTNGSGVATFTVSESSFEGQVIYFAYNEYTTP